MRAAFFIALLIPVSVFADTEFWLEQLSNNAAQYTAPPDLQKTMALLTNKDLKGCRSQLSLSSSASSQYFAVAPIALSSSGTPTFIVFPSKYCYCFFGMHSVQFWVVAQDKNKTYRLLLSAREDGVKVLSSTTNGYSDLKLYYGTDETNYTFNGKFYNEEQL